MQSKSFSQFLHFMSDYRYFVIDENVYNLHLKNKVELQHKVVFLVKEPEAYKSFKFYELGLNFFLDNKIKRHDTLLCIGGGATTDFGGFLASTLLRGISWIAVPTTLLAMVDASIGGKVGINTTQGKNLVGNFHLPQKEIICESFLDTLPSMEVQSGYGEIIKYYFLSPDVKKLINSDASLNDIIHNCVKFKKDIVKQDYEEKDIRDVLNFGHTFGHAIEKTLHIEHGIAVAFGIFFNLKIFSPNLLEDYENLLKKFKISLPTEKIDWSKFSTFLRNDKKNTDDKNVRFISVLGNGSRRIDLTIEQIKQLMIESKLYEDYFQ